MKLLKARCPPGAAQKQRCLIHAFMGGSANVFKPAVKVYDAVLTSPEHAFLVIVKSNQSTDNAGFHDPDYWQAPEQSPERMRERQVRFLPC